MNRKFMAGVWRRRTAWAAAVISLCLPAGLTLAQQQQRNAPAPRQAPRSESRPQPARPQNQPGRYQNQPSRPQSQGRPYAQPQYRPNVSRPSSSMNRYQNAPGYPRGNPQNGSRPLYPGPPYLGPNSPRPVYPGYPAPAYSYSPPGHLGSWLNDHRGIPVQDQERMLRGD